MTVVHLVRHAPHDGVGRVLTGRTPGATLGAAGRAAAAALGRRFAEAPLAGVFASPRERAVETAAAIAAPHGLAVTVLDALDEIDFGAWTGRTFDALADDPGFRAWNAHRGLAATPAGARMADVQARMLDALARATAAAGGGETVLVGHADPIRALVAAVIGLPLDAVLRIDVDPASITRIDVGPGHARLVHLNLPAAPPAPSPPADRRSDRP